MSQNEPNWQIRMSKCFLTNTPAQTKISVLIEKGFKIWLTVRSKKNKNSCIIQDQVRLNIFSRYLAEIEGRKQKYWSWLYIIATKICCCFFCFVFYPPNHPSTPGRGNICEYRISSNFVNYYSSIKNRDKFPRGLFTS